jgi:hypothetical protein
VCVKLIVVYFCAVVGTLLVYTEWPKKMYTLFTHQYLWNKSVLGSNTSRILPMGSLKDDVYRRKPATLDDLRENIAMLCVAITLGTLQNVVHTAVRRLRQWPLRTRTLNPKFKDISHINFAFV